MMERVAARWSTMVLTARLGCVVILGSAVMVVEGVGCASTESPNLSSQVPCSIDNPCQEGESCLNDRCIIDGSLAEGDTCSAQRQCGNNLVCLDFECTVGCTDLYYLDQCTDDTWCKPREGQSLVTASGERVALGNCAPSECDPSTTTECDAGVACVQIAPTVGACLPYCRYGFDNNAYFDTCNDTDDVDYACQPLGQTSVPVCIPAGGKDAPRIGVPGCDAIHNPCAAGTICLNIMCRRLCSDTQLLPCPQGDTCTPLGERSDVSYCRSE